METKEIKINIPEGYEIDKENSTFECIKFKLIKKYITYEKISEKLFNGYCASYINNFGGIKVSVINGTYNRPNIAPYGIQLTKLLALNKLLNIAYYYNSMPYITTGYYIGYDKLKDKYFVESLNNSFAQAAEITILFMKAEDAQAVIDNPNFRDILDTLCK